MLALGAFLLASPARAQQVPEDAAEPPARQPPGGETKAPQAGEADSSEAGRDAGADGEAPGAGEPSGSASSAALPARATRDSQESSEKDGASPGSSDGFDVPEETAATVADAPRPDDTVDYQVAPPGPGAARTAWRVVGFVPYWVARIALTPVRGLLWVYERYALDVRFREIFFTEDGTIGLFPLITNEAGFGLSLGAKFLHRSVFGQGEKLSFTATARGASRAYASLVANSGNRWRGFRLRGNLTYNSQRRARFSGIGNEDSFNIDDSSQVPEPIDPFSSLFAIDSRYTFDELSARFGADFDVTDRLVVQVLGEYIRRTYDPNNEDSERYDVFTGDVYDTDALTAFEDGLKTLSAMLVVQYDRSSVSTRYNSRAVPSRGYRATGLLGYAYGLGDDPSNFVRGSAALEGFFDLYAGDRVLAVRAFYETVSADREDVPFDQLPTLGGANLLRGYVRGRFRDSSVALLSAEYSYPVLNIVAGFLFVDAGVPFSGLDDFSLDQPRVGFGAGLQLQTQDAALGRLDVSSSIDGGFLLNLTFQPFFRVDRRAQ